MIKNYIINITEIDEQFSNSYFPLNEELIYRLDKDDNSGGINNVIIGVNKECFGTRLFEVMNEPIVIEIYYINYDLKLNGDLIRIELDNPNYSFLLFKFCRVISLKYKCLNEIHTFNTFQKQLRTVLEKDGYFTVTSIELNELKKYGSDGTFINVHYKGLKRIDLIPIVDFYREIFEDNYKISNENLNEYVYLMINSKTGLIKIGYSKSPKYREKTLQSAEPEVFLIACWNTGRNVETELHRKFKKNRVRGEYFKLNFNDLQQLKDYMKNITQYI